MTTLSEAQTRTLLDAVAGDRLEAVYVLAVTSGMRQGELLGLRWRDLDLEASALQVRSTLGSSADSVMLAEPKTRSSRRRVTLTRVAVSALRGHKVRQAQERLAAGTAWDDHELVFANLVGRPLDGTKVIKLFHAELEEIGLPKIRSTIYATPRRRCYSAGASIRRSSANNSATPRSRSHSIPTAT
jgi:integrase